jgi:iron complex transport system substrate-binding protein
MRVVSLLPAATEIAWGLGAGAEVVGRSHECDWPPGAEKARVVSRPRLDPSLPGPELHASVRALLERGLSIYEIDAEALRDLRPDVILTQDQCAVCAVPLAQVERAACEVLGTKAAVVSLSPLKLGDVRENFRQVGRALGRDAAGLVRAFDAELGRVRALPLPAPRPRVLGLEWLDPPMAAGNWFGELIEAAGGLPAVPPTVRTERISWDDVDSCRASLTVASPCGFPLDRALDALRGIARALPGRVCAIDGNSFINRPGPRLAESAAILAAALRGERADMKRWAWWDGGRREGAPVV